MSSEGKFLLVPDNTRAGFLALDSDEGEYVPWKVGCGGDDPDVDSECCSPEDPPSECDGTNATCGLSEGVCLEANFPRILIRPYTPYVPGTDCEPTQEDYPDGFPGRQCSRLFIFSCAQHDGIQFTNQTEWLRTILNTTGKDPRSAPFCCCRECGRNIMIPPRSYPCASGQSTPDAAYPCCNDSDAAIEGGPNCNSDCGSAASGCPNSVLDRFPFYWRHCGIGGWSTGGLDCPCESGPTDTDWFHFTYAEWRTIYTHVTGQITLPDTDKFFYLILHLNFRRNHSLCDSHSAVYLVDTWVTCDPIGS